MAKKPHHQNQINPTQIQSNQVNSNQIHLAEADPHSNPDQKYINSNDRKTLKPIQLN